MSQAKQQTLTPEQPQQLQIWLCAIANQRDEDAFSQLFKWFAPKIIAFGIKQLNSKDSAHDLLQETMSNVWKKAHLFDIDKGSATTWVYIIMRNASFDMLRKIRSQKEDHLSDDIWPLAEEHHHLYEENELGDHLLNEKMAEQIERLPLEQQQLIKGIYFHELTQQQLACQLNIPLGTVKSRLRLAFSKLKTLIGESS